MIETLLCISNEINGDNFMNFERKEESVLNVQRHSLIAPKLADTSRNIWSAGKEINLICI